jgi:hypothetical protein
VFRFRVRFLFGSLSFFILQKKKLTLTSMLLLSTSAAASGPGSLIVLKAVFASPGEAVSPACGSAGRNPTPLLPLFSSTAGGRSRGRSSRGTPASAAQACASASRMSRKRCMNWSR